MKPAPPRARSWTAPALATAWFVAAGLLLMPLPGWQNDELFFAGPLYDKTAAFFYVHVGALRLPVMVASYTGALKTWLYGGVFHLLEPSSSSIRGPMLMMGVLTLWLTWSWMLQMGAGIAASVVAIALLATDASFLMSTTFDWGPVALQHVFLMAGLVALQGWIARPAHRKLALAFFLWGVGLWDKALMIWPLSGLAIAAAVVYPREIARRVRPGAVAVAAAAFAVGCAPFLWYNIARPGEFVSRNVSLSPDDLTMKIGALRDSIDGSSMFGYIASRDNASRRRDPLAPIQRASVALSRKLGAHQRNWMPFGLALAFVCFIARRRSSEGRPLLFLLTAMLVAWLEMFLNKGTGTFVHHVVLIWPLPFVFAGVAFSAAASQLGRHAPIALTAVTLLLLTGNLLNDNEYLARLAANGGVGGWTDAIDNLAVSLQSRSPAWIGLVDWGCLNGLRVIYRGKRPLFDAAEYVNNIEALDSLASVPSLLLVQHVAGKEMIPHINERFRAAVQSQGFEEKIVDIVRDHEGKPVFEVFGIGGAK